MQTNLIHSVLRNDELSILYENSLKICHIRATLKCFAKLKLPVSKKL